MQDIDKDNIRLEIFRKKQLGVTKFTKMRRPYGFPFRTFGFAFWSSERMAASGLMPLFPQNGDYEARRHRYW